MGYRHDAVRPWRLRGRPQRAAALSLAVAALACCGTAGVATVAIADEPAAEASAVVSLRKGDRGPAVRRVQGKLDIPVDGMFGGQTDRAVRRFQRRRGLMADGIIGPVTRRALGLRPFGRDSVVHPKRRGVDRDDDGAGDTSGGAVAGEEEPEEQQEGSPALPAELARIAECESGGDPRAVSPDGVYRGKYQFMRSTWKANGGRGDDPAQASEAHQDRVALRVYREQGTAPWPSCG